MNDAITTNSNISDVRGAINAALSGQERERRAFYMSHGILEDFYSDPPISPELRDLFTVLKDSDMLGALYVAIQEREILCEKIRASNEGELKPDSVYEYLDGQRIRLKERLAPDFGDGFPPVPLGYWLVEEVGMEDDGIWHEDDIRTTCTLVEDPAA